jgi:hypothetical protein
VSVAEQWTTLGSELPDSWVRAELRLELPDAKATERAAAVLGPASPFRAGPTDLRFAVARDGSAVGPENLVRLLRRIHRGTLALDAAQAAARPAPRKTTPLAAAWDEALGALPADWSHLYAELELTSSDYIEPAAVFCIQMNPRRDGNRAAFRFRCARRAGYGVAPEMARQCFVRCDAGSVRGTVTILRVLSDAQLVATQGPVWVERGLTI